MLTTNAHRQVQLLLAITAESEHRKDQPSVADGAKKLIALPVRMLQEQTP